MWIPVIKFIANRVIITGRELGYNAASNSGNTANANDIATDTITNYMDITNTAAVIHWPDKPDTINCCSTR